MQASRVPIRNVKEMLNIDFGGVGNSRTVVLLLKNAILTSYFYQIVP